MEGGSAKLEHWRVGGAEAGTSSGEGETAFSVRRSGASPERGGRNTVWPKRDGRLCPSARTSQSKLPT